MGYTQQNEESDGSAERGALNKTWRVDILCRDAGCAIEVDEAVRIYLAYRARIVDGWLICDFLASMTKTEVLAVLGKISHLWLTIEVWRRI